MKIDPSKLGCAPLCYRTIYAYPALPPEEEARLLVRNDKWGSRLAPAGPAKPISKLPLDED